MFSHRLLLCAALGCTFVSSLLLADDWPAFRGPRQDGISLEKDWRVEWPDDGPKTLWKANVGIGFGSFSVAQGRVYTSGFADDKDTIFCFDALKGTEIWKYSYPSELGDKYYEGGTSATPTVDGDKVYWLGRWGDTICFDAAKGTVVWEKNLQKELDMPIPDWGYSGSPLVLGEKLILNMGHAGVALEKSSGKVLWQSDKKPSGYATPVLAKIKGREQLLIASAGSYVGVDPKDGKVLWEHPFKNRYLINAADPIVTSDTTVFISSGYGHGAALLDLSSGKPVEKWRNKDMRNQFNTCVLLDGHLYGVDGDDSQNPTLRCMNAATGKILWTHTNFGAGSVIAAHGHLIALTGKGELMIAPATPKEFAPVARFQAMGGKTWTMPVLANGLIYCRNAAGQVVCLDLRKS